MIAVEKYIEVATKHQISPNQYLLLMILLHRKYALLYKYSEEGKSSFKKNEVEDLLQKGYIRELSFSKRGPHYDNLEVSLDFEKMLYKDHPELMFQIFWSIYPQHQTKNDQKLNAKDANYQQLEKNYLEKIGKNIDLHMSIICKVEELKRSNSLNKNIQRFFEEVRS